jgi:hypothetical protein
MHCQHLGYQLATFVNANPFQTSRLACFVVGHYLSVPDDVSKIWILIVQHSGSGRDLIEQGMSWMVCTIAKHNPYIVTKYTSVWYSKEDDCIYGSIKLALHRVIGFVLGSCHIQALYSNQSSPQPPISLRRTLAVIRPPKLWAMMISGLSFSCQVLRQA